MLGGEGVSDDYEVGSKRPRMMESNPYFAVSSSYRHSFGSGYTGSPAMFSFPVVRLRGLPFSCTILDIYKFFAGLDVVDILLVNKNGLFSGEAYVVFASPMQAEVALQRNRQNIGHRYIEVFMCAKQDYYNAIANEVNSSGTNNEYYHTTPPPRPKKTREDKEQMEYTEVLKLRGLPYSATKREIIDFFGDYELNEDNVHIAIRPDGKATGEAYVEFTSSDEAKKAMSKDRMSIGSRYVELFPSTPEEAKRAASRPKW